jgi:hypothetical protein
MLREYAGVDLHSTQLTIHRIIIDEAHKVHRYSEQIRLLIGLSWAVAHAGLASSVPRLYHG